MCECVLHRRVDRHQPQCLQNPLPVKVRRYSAAVQCDVITTAEFVNGIRWDRVAKIVDELSGFELAFDALRQHARRQLVQPIATVELAKVRASCRVFEQGYDGGNSCR